MKAMSVAVQFSAVRAVLVSLGSGLTFSVFTFWYWTRLHDSKLDREEYGDFDRGVVALVDWYV